MRVAKMAMTCVARALEVDETRGFMKAIVDGDRADTGRGGVGDRRWRNHGGIQLR